MPVPELLFDLSRLDLQKIELPIEEIRKINPHRFEIEQLSGIYRMIPEEGIIVGFKDVRSDEFWVRGHIPGHPLLPGVLMVEAAAQLSSVYQCKMFPTDGFFGFGGIEDVRFRSAVRPGDKLILIGKAVTVHPRRSIFQTQGVVGDKLAFEATIIGVNIPRGKLG
jgi:3-hydroxyacyl-[acyl-carrier-protein] dehydratase